MSKEEREVTKQMAKRKRTTEEAFIKAWNSSESIQEVSDKVKTLKPNSVYQNKYKLAKKGIKLKHLPMRAPESKKVLPKEQKSDFVAISVPENRFMLDMTQRAKSEVDRLTKELAIATDIFEILQDGSTRIFDARPRNSGIQTAHSH